MSLINLQTGPQRPAAQRSANDGSASSSSAVAQPQQLIGRTAIQLLGFFQKQLDDARDALNEKYEAELRKQVKAVPMVAFVPPPARPLFSAGEPFRVDATPLLRQLRTFLSLLRGTSTATVAVDWSAVAAAGSDPDAFDVAVVPCTGFAVRYALFFLQNERRFGNLRLFHIVQSRSMTVHFLRLVQLATTKAVKRSRLARVLDAQSWARERDWFEAQSDLETDQPASEPFQYPPTAAVQPLSVLDLLREALGPPSPLMGMLRDAFKVPPTVTEDDLAALQAAMAEEMRLPDAVQKFATKQHALVQMVLLLALQWRLQRTSPSLAQRVVLQGEIQRTLQWLASFAIRGCACSV